MSYVSSLIPCERLQASSYSNVLILGALVYTVEPLLVEIVSIQIQICLQVVIDFIWFCYIVFKSFIFSLSVDQTLCVSDTISKDHSNKYKYYTKRSHWNISAKTTTTNVLENILICIRELPTSMPLEKRWLCPALIFCTTLNTSEGFLFPYSSRRVRVWITGLKFWPPTSGGAENVVRFWPPSWTIVLTVTWLIRNIVLQWTAM